MSSKTSVFSSPRLWGYSALLASMSLAPIAHGDVEQLHGDEMGDVYIMDTVTVKPKNESSSTPYYDGDLQHREDRDDPLSDIAQQAQSQATQRGLAESLGLDTITSDNAYSFDFGQHVNDGIAQMLDAPPDGVVVGGSNGNYTLTNQGVTATLTQNPDNSWTYALPNGLTMTAGPNGLQIDGIPRNGIPADTNVPVSAPVVIDNTGSTIGIDIHPPQ
ncbi:hypothetical protein [Kistimonas scapharcae]|uniref:hypothetical protein n=1 Tax=Kistimonas scapharcae TaxID=1036133 RepID=UPI0031F10A32